MKDAEGHPVTSAWQRIQGLGAMRLVPLGFGLGILVGGTIAGWDGRLLTMIATPPPVIRAALLGLSMVAGLALLAGAVRRLSASEPIPGGERDLISLTRGVRLVFLAVAAFAAVGGWALGYALLIVVGLVIAGVDVLETLFLFFVIAIWFRSRFDI